MTEAQKGSAGLIKIGERGVNLQSFEDAWRFAEGIIKGGMVPKGMNQPGAVVGIIEAGLELGVPPIMALSHLQFTNGKLSADGTLALALVRSKGGLKPGTDAVITYSGAEFTPEWTCTVELWKVGSKAPVSQPFSLQEAINAGLCKLKDGKIQTHKRDGSWGFWGAPWSNYPKRMLFWRALGFLLTEHFSEYILGLVIAQEMQDYPGRESPTAERDVTPPAAPTGADPLLELASASHQTEEVTPEVPAGSEATGGSSTEERVEPSITDTAVITPPPLPEAGSEPEDAVIVPSDPPIHFPPEGEEGFALEPPDDEPPEPQEIPGNDANCAHEWKRYQDFDICPKCEAMRPLKTEVIRDPKGRL